jgi:hypothetical protein
VSVGAAGAAVAASTPAKRGLFGLGKKTRR